MLSDVRAADRIHDIRKDQFALQGSESWNPTILRLLYKKGVFGDMILITAVSNIIESISH